MIPKNLYHIHEVNTTVTFNCTSWWILKRLPVLLDQEVEWLGCIMLEVLCVHSEALQNLLSMARKIGKGCLEIRALCTAIMGKWRQVFPKAASLNRTWFQCSKSSQAWTKVSTQTTMDGKCKRLAHQLRGFSWRQQSRVWMGGKLIMKNKEQEPGNGMRRWNPMKRMGNYSRTLMLNLGSFKFSRFFLSCQSEQT